MSGATVERIGFQGEAGAFSEQAARELFGEHISTRGYLDFDALVQAVDRREVEFGLLPCENTIYGPIARAYDLLLQYPLVRIVDETSHAIAQCLIGIPASTLEAIERVLSHPVALEQCGVFLKAHPTMRIETVNDTAGAVRSIIELGDRHSAAIGPRLAAEIYGGLVLADAIADDAENVTRFLVISRSSHPRRSLGRLCLAFSLQHEPGSLHKALGGIVKQKSNLRSLVARPKKGTPFEYRFIVEMDWPTLKSHASMIIPGAIDVRVLGHY